MSPKWIKTRKVLGGSERRYSTQNEGGHRAYATHSVFGGSQGLQCSSLSALILALDQGIITQEAKLSRTKPLS